MAGKERENFYKNSTLIVDHAKDSLVDVLELHLTINSLSFEDFINLHQHDIYHLCFNKKQCCQCAQGYVSPHNRVLHQSQLEILLDKNGVARPCHVPGKRADFCCCLAKPGVTTNVLDITLARCLLINFCDDVFRRSYSLREKIDKLHQMRNNVYGHAKEGRITDGNYRTYKNEIESAILEIAQVCGNEAEKKQILMDLEKRSLDETLCIQYQNTLLEQIAKETQLEEKLNDLVEKVQEIEEKVVVKTSDGDTEQKLTKDQQKRKEKLKQLKENTHNCIQTHITEKTFVKTNLITEGFKKLNENGIVILTGKPGIGKSRNSLELLRTFCTENQGYSAIWLQSISEWSELINADDNLIVLIDDVFGRKNITFDGNEDLQLLDIIYSTIQKGTVKVILTMQNTIKLALYGVEDSHRMLKDVNFLDINSDCLQMTRAEKKECLLNHCKKNNIQESFTKDSNCHDIAILDPEMPVYLSWIQIQDIANINVCPLLGFPESCYLFANNRKFTRQGVAFFKHPTQMLCDEISNIRTLGKDDKSKALEYAILVYIMLNGDCFDPLKINCEKVKQIIELIYDPSSIKLTTMKIKKCVGLLMGRYLKLKEDNTVCFQHRTIFESVLLTYKDDDPELVIPLLDKDFLLELGCLENYKPQIGEVTFEFYSESYKQLASQLVTYLKLAPSPHDFIKTLCSSRIIRYADKSMLEEFYNAYKSNKIDMYLGMRWLVEIESEKGSWYEEYMNFENVNFTLLKYMLQYSINFTDNTNVIMHILNLISKEMSVHSAICVKERYTRCFTSALLQSCASNDKARLSAILNFIKTEHIKLDEEIILSFHTKSIQVNTFELLVATVKDCELIDISVLMKKVIALDAASLLYIIIDQYDCKSCDIRSAMDTACEEGAINIVRMFCEHFDISVCDMQSLMLTVCECGHTEIVKLLLDKLDHKIFDLDAAMKKSINLLHEYFPNRNGFNIIYVLLTSANHVFKVKEIMDIIRNVNLSSPEINNKDCSILVKYLLETYSISNFDLKVVIEIAGLSRDSDILQLVLQMMNINDFYQIWMKEKHFENHTTMVLERLFESGCCTDIDVITLMNTEMRHHNVNGIKYLMEKFDWRYFDIKTVIEYSLSDDYFHSNEGAGMLVILCHSPPDLMLWILKTFDYNRFDMRSILEMALKRKMWDLVEWIWENIDVKMLDIKLVIQSVTKYSKGSKLSWLLENFDLRLFDLKSMMTSACIFDNISLVRSMTDKFGIEMFQSRHIMQFAVRNLKNGSSDIVKLCLKNSINIGEYNMIELFNMACKHTIVELIEWLLVHYDPMHFHFNSAIAETLKWGRYNILKLLLVKLDHIFLDMESIIHYLCRKRAFDIAMWMLDAFHPHLADIRFVMSMACQHGELHLVQCIIRQYGIRMFNIKSIFDDACKSESSSLLKWLHQNIKISHNCNLNNFHKYSFRNIIFLIENNKIISYDYNLYNIISKHLCHTLDNSRIYMEFLTWLLNTVDHTLLDVKLVFNHVCRYGTMTFAKWIMGAFDKKLLDFQSAILEAAKNDNFELVTFLFKMKPVKKPSFDVNSVFLEACHHCNVQLVNWLLDKFEHRMFSVSEGISRSCPSFECEEFIMNLIKRCEHNLIDFNIVIQAYRGNLSFTFMKQLMKIADTSKVDVPVVMHQECNRSYPNWDFVKFMFTTYDCKIFDMKLIFNSACHKGTPEIVKWLLDNYGRDVFDLKSGFNEACCEDGLDKVKLLVESVGTEHFDLQSAVQLTMNKYRLVFLLRSDEIVKYLLNSIQPSVSDLQCVMDKVCPTGNTVLVNWLIESFDCSKLDLNSTIGRIFDKEQHCRDMLELLLQSFDHDRFDMMSIIIQANHRGYREVVFMVIKTVHHSFFDMKTVLLEICKGGNLETVMYLIETCHYEDLVDEVFILNAFRTGSSDIVNWLLHKRKGEIIDTKTAMSNACIGGHTQLVQYLLAKYKFKHFDLRSAIHTASYYGRTEVVQYFLQVFHYETFDMDAVMYHACASGRTGLVKWLLGVYDHRIFNIESGVTEDVKNEMAKCENSMHDFYDHLT